MPDPDREAPVLVVDDDPAILSAVADVLRIEGYQVETAANGEQALTLLEGTAPALVLLDMRMPVLDGWAFARAARERGLELKTIVMTAAQDAKSWAAEIGATGFLAKPFQIDELIATVEDHWPHAAAREESNGGRLAGAEGFEPSIS